MKLFSGLLALGAIALSAALTVPANAQGVGENWSVDETCGAAVVALSPCSESGVPGTITGIDRVTFSYNGVVKQFNADEPSLLSNDPFIEKGYMEWNSYLNDAGVAIFGQDLNNDYKVYGIFNATGVASVIGGEIVVTFTTFTIDFYVDDDGDTVLSLPADPSVAGPAGEVTRGGVIADDNLFATATILDTGEAFLRNSLANGDFEVILTDFGRNLFGEDFLVDPNPFYTRMNLGGRTLTVNGASATNAFIATLDGEGSLFFTIPEPGTKEEGKS